MKPSTLDRQHYESYLIRLYFGSGSDPLILCLNRAYRDFNRTLHQISSIEGKDDLYIQVRSYLYGAFKDLKLTSIKGQGGFDNWHQTMCYQLQGIYAEWGYHNFFIGQGQKWINMTFKYIFTMGSSRIPGYEEFQRFCHVPLDNILLAQLEPYDFPVLSARWSRLNDYQEYLSCQNWIRNTFRLNPLDTEFKLWLGEDVATK